MQLRRLTPLVGGLLLTPIFVALPLDLSQAGPTPHPVQGDSSQTPLVERPASGVDGADHATSPEISQARQEVTDTSAGAQRLPDQGVTVLKLTTPQPVKEHLSAVGLTWKNGTGGATAAQLRTFKDGRWGEWETMEVDPSTGPDSGAPKKNSVPADQRKIGSELYMVSGATQVQARILGAPGHAPVDPQLTVIDPGESEADATVGTAQVGAAQAVTPRPAIYTRAQWGADESWRTGTPENNTPRGIVIHHTADTNNYTADMVPGMMRSMYRYATKILGWDDIAYNFVIDRWGRIWQGRAWLYPEQPVFPAAQLSNNDRGVGVSMLGNYEEERLSGSARAALVKLLAWKASLHGINPLGSTTWYNNKTDRYETMPTINGHRDHYYTACPGANLYPLIPGIRKDVAAAMSSPSGPVTPSSTVFRDFDGMQDSDVLGRDPSSKLTLSSPNGKGDMTPMELIGGPGWDKFDVVTIVGDWNGDGTPDIIARKNTTAELWLYPGDGKGSFYGSKTIGFNWNGMQAVIAPGDWNGDGKPDIITTSKVDGKMYLYSGNGRGGYSAAGVVIGHGWQNIRALAGVGDWNGDGKVDVMAITHDGRGIIYYGDGKGGFPRQFVLNGDFGRFASLVGIWNAYGDKKSAVLGVTSDGSGYISNRTGDASVDTKKIGESYAGFTVFSG